MDQLLSETHLIQKITPRSYIGLREKKTFVINNQFSKLCQKHVVPLYCACAVHRTFTNKKAMLVDQLRTGFSSMWIRCFHVFLKDSVHKCPLFMKLVDCLSRPVAPISG